MTHLPPEDKHWQTFLRHHRPTPPPAPSQLEDRLMDTIETSQQPESNERIWVWPPAIAAGLLVAWSSYRTLVPPLPELHTARHLETFLENNWNGVMGETAIHPSSNSVQDDWTLLANTAQ